MLQQASAHKRELAWLDPPHSLGAVTVLDVHVAADAEQHGERVWQWARSVWHAWAPHQQPIGRWSAEK